jgi:hypothetical protein
MHNFFQKKKTQENNNREELPQLDQEHPQKPTANIILSDERLEASTPGTRQGFCSYHLLSIALAVLSSSIRQKNEIKGTKFRKKEMKLSLFAGDRIFYLQK